MSPKSTKPPKSCLRPSWSRTCRTVLPNDCFGAAALFATNPFAPTGREARVGQQRTFTDAAECPGSPILRYAYRVRLPEAYLFVRASNAHRGHWTAGVLQACRRAAIDARSVEIIDEEDASATGNLSSVVLKICDQLPAETIQRLPKEIEATGPQGASIWVIRGVSPENFALDPEDILTEYFRHEFVVGSNMIHHAESCVRLTHRSTGRSARSTAHRSRALNSEEALLLLECLVRSGSAAA